MTFNPELVHATAIALNGRGILLAGKSGSGKSDLAIRLIDRGAKLVCDDYCEIAVGENAPLILAKEKIARVFMMPDTEVPTCFWCAKSRPIPTSA